MHKSELKDLETTLQKSMDSRTNRFHDACKKEHVIGKTRIYVRLGALEYTESERQKGWDVWAFGIWHYMYNVHFVDICYVVIIHRIKY